MKEKFPAVFALLGVEEMQMTEEGTFLNAGLLETLNANIEAAKKEKADALALVESLTAEKNELTAKVEELTAQAETKDAEHAKAVEDLNAAHATAIEEKDSQISALQQTVADLKGDMECKQNQIDQLQADVDGAKSSLETASKTIEERDQQIEDLNGSIAEKDAAIETANKQIEDLKAEVKELSKEERPMIDANAGAAPAGNGTGDAPKTKTSRIKRGMSYKQIREAMKEE